MSDLTKFLLARIAQDEAAMRSDYAPYATHSPDCNYPGDMPGYCDCNLRERIIAGCDAQRRIISLHSRHEWLPEGRDECSECGFTIGIKVTAPRSRDGLERTE